MANPNPDYNTRIKRRKRSPSTDMDSSGDDQGGVPVDSAYYLQKPTDWGTHRHKKFKPIKKEEEEDDVDSKPDPVLARVKAEPAKSKQDQYSPAKVKDEPAEEKKYNPYLAHMQQQTVDAAGYSNGYGHFKADKLNGAPEGTTIGWFRRHETTAAMAKKAEDGPNNPFNGKVLSSQYFNILQTRRNLPVHAQR